MSKWKMRIQRDEGRVAAFAKQGEGFVKGWLKILTFDNTLVISLL
jgi:hypothetical protein